MTGGPVAPATADTAERLGGSVTTGDRVFDVVTTACALAVPALLLLVLVEVGRAAWPALAHGSASLVASARWDPPHGEFGAAGAIVGTVVTSVLAVALAAPLALSVAVYGTEFAPPRLRAALAWLLDLLAAVPSIAYGLWGAFVLVPAMRAVVIPALQGLPLVGRLPLFAGPAYGPGLLTAAVLLAIMILPYMAAVTREVLAAVPRAQREAALGLGATRWEMVRDAVLPWARAGIVGGVVLGLGRALGETMAVTMVIGNRHDLPTSLLAPGYTMASLIANEFSEASGDLHLSALMAVGLVLLVVTVGINALARLLVARVASGPGR